MADVDRWSGSWFTGALDAMIALRGEGSTFSGHGPLSGRRMPRTSAIDSIAILGQLSPALVGAVARISLDGKAWPSGMMNADGIDRASPTSGDYAALILKGPLPAKEYVAGYGYGPAPYKRSKAGVSVAGTVIVQGATWEPMLARTALGGEETAQIAGLREAMRSWQACCDASAALLKLTPTDLSTPQTGTIVDEFWRRVRLLCVDLDVLGENPPRERIDRLKDAIVSSSKQTATFVAESAGELAAGVADMAGRTAGTFAESFFKNATAISLAVGVIAVYYILG